MYKNLNLGALGHNKVPFDAACTIAQHNNFAGIDPDLGYLSNLAQTRTLQDAKDWFAATGLRIGAFGLNAAWRENDSDAAFADSLPKLEAEAKLAAALGSTRCTTWVMPRSDKHTYYQQFSLVVPRLKQAAAVLAQYGVSLGLEFIGPDTLRAGTAHDFVHTMDGMRALAAAAGPNVGLLLDLWHWFTARGTVLELTQLAVEEVVYVHLNDAPPGLAVDQLLDQEREMVGATGVLPTHDFLVALKNLGYTGPLTVEPFNAAVNAMTPEQAAATTSAALDKVLKGV